MKRSLADKIRHENKYVPAIYSRELFWYAPVEHFHPVRLSELPTYQFDFTVFMSASYPTRAFAVSHDAVYTFQNATEAVYVHDMLSSGMSVDDIIAYTTLTGNTTTID